VFACVAGIMIILSLIPSKEVIGEVRAVSWTRAIEIEELRDVTKEDWRDKVPSGAAISSCTQKYHHTQDNPAPNAEEVCGTPYTVDTGSGYGKVVQDCKYKVYKDWCAYTVKEWKQVDVVTLRGDDYDPHWPAPRLGLNRREGDRKEKYQVILVADGKTWTGTPAFRSAAGGPSS
jgi:hypothetical protein